MPHLLMLCLAIGCADHSGSGNVDKVDTGGGDSGGTDAIDADGDGFAADVDCDDADPSVTPATEVWIPAGPFIRGEDMSYDAKPAMEITLSDYCIDVYEVTNAEFAAFMNERSAAGYPNVDDSGQTLFDFADADDEVPERILDNGDGTYSVSPGYEDHPVVEVYHWSALAYCGSRGQTVPTEAQWEKAARGPDQWDWPWGPTEPSCDIANMILGEEGVDENGVPYAVPCQSDTLPVGSYPDWPGAYGTLDMGGNAAEWVYDWYRSDYYATSPTSDPMGPESGWSVDFPQGPDEARLTRGGSFASGMFSVSTYGRYVERPYGSSNGVGFRCARPL